MQENATTKKQKQSAIAKHMRPGQEAWTRNLEKGQLEEINVDLYVVTAGVVVVDRRNGWPARIYGVGEAFGYENLYPKAAAIGGIRALEKAEIACYRVSTIRAMTRAGGNFAEELIKDLAGQINHAYSMGGEIVQRVAKILLELETDFGVVGEDPQTTVLKLDWLTQELLAKLVDTSREIITAKISMFRRMGVLTYERGLVVFIDPVKLEGIADGSVEVEAKKKKA